MQKPASEEPRIDPSPVPKIKKPKETKKNSRNVQSPVPNLTQLLISRFVILTRIAERVDRAFPEWLTVGFSDNGESDEYKAYDSNLPSAVLKRPEGRNAYVDDAPIPELGIKNSLELGGLIASSGMWPVDVIYVSPSLRYIQTASIIAHGAGDNNVKIRVELALCDYMGWYEKIPQFFSPEFFVGIGQLIDINYKPLKTVEQMQVFIKRESLEMFYSRISKVMLKLTRSNGEQGSKRILFVMHATCMDAAVKAFKNSTCQAVTESDFLHLGSYYPLSSTITLAHDRDKWSYVQDPIPALNYRGITTHVNNSFISRTTIRQKEKSPVNK